MEMKVDDKLKKVIIGIAIAVLVFSIGMVIKIASLSIENSKLVDELSRKEAESMEMDEKNAALEALLKVACTDIECYLLIHNLSL